ncbi:MAG: sulfurtransferase, partial [Nitrospirae bacterium]|nr:sulfurtransferase [Nitrospirota bacterium]
QGDTILVMCRSGHRSAAAVNRLTKAGFMNVYSIVDGFEGDKVKDGESYFNGKRMKNGWKNSGALWTYDLEPRLIYTPEK